ncbi:MAG: alkaline phosphatase family protein [Anaerolineales bacterium]
MADLSNELLPKLQAHRIPGLDLGDGFIYPAYAGQSILNLPASVCAWLGVPTFGAPALRAEILSKHKGPYQRVVLLLVDALAFHLLQAWMKEPEFAVWGQLAETGLLAPLTSVSPSTTAAALTSLWTGSAPAEHGIVGYEVWLKEYGMVANMIGHAPFSFQRQAGSLAQAGFVPEEFLGLPTLGAHLALHGVQPYALQHYSILGSGLSTMFFPGVQRVGYFSPNDLWINLRHLMHARPKEKSFYWAYWADVDTLSHKYGPGDERVRADFAAFSQAFKAQFLDRLEPELRKDTLFLLVADHGVVHTEKDPHYDLRNHPNLTRRLHMQPTGENRLVYLYIRPGQTEAVREYIETTWPNQFAILESSFAQEVGLFGAGPFSPRLSERIGDLVVAARGTAYWWWAAKENPLIGRHGGLTTAEMVVPLLAAPL